MTFGFKKFVLYSINKAWTKQIKNCLPDRYQAATSQEKPALNRNGSSEVARGAGLCPEWFAAFSCALGVHADKIGKWQKCQQLSREWWGWGCHIKTSGSLREWGPLTQSQLEYAKSCVQQGETHRTGTVPWNGSCSGHRTECDLPAWGYGRDTILAYP